MVTVEEVTAWLKGMVTLEFRWHPERIGERNPKTDGAIDLAFAFTKQSIEEMPGLSNWIYVGVPDGPVDINIQQAALPAFPPKP